jgi:accessory gene regulator B
MINRFAESVSEYFVENEIVPADDKNIYKYGIEVMISSAFGILSIILISAILGKVQDGILFLLCFVPIRVYAGGFHMNTYLTCNITFISVFLLIFSLSPILPDYLGFIFIFISLISIALLSPIKNKHKNLSALEKKKYMKISIIISNLWGVISTVLLIFNINIISLVSVTMLSIAIFMIIEKIIKIKIRRKI